MIRGVDGCGCSPRLRVAQLPDNGTKSMKLLAVAAVQEEEVEEEEDGLAKWLAVRQTRPARAARSVRSALCFVIIY